jgi:hypothetical protein
MKNIVVAVRRSRSARKWLVPDNERHYFTNEFGSALLQGATFIHEARAMTCEPGYDSTGEAKGRVVEYGTEDMQMPPEIKNQLAVVYDRERRRFHAADKPEQVIDSADYLLLKSDGTAIAGWKK